jgi:hypothetical protein
MKTTQTTYQLIKKKKDGSEKVIQETQSSCIERAMDYFYMIKPKAYYDKKYRICVKPTPIFSMN